jgi:hypothetical protein
MSKEIVNLRAQGTDTANPTGGTLVGTAEIEVSGPNREPQLLIATADGWPDTRLFVFVKGTFAYGGTVPAEYVEVRPTAVHVVESASTTT